jgi:hypothetical protein
MMAVNEQPAKEIMAKISDQNLLKVNFKSILFILFKKGWLVHWSQRFFFLTS